MQWFRNYLPDSSLSITDRGVSYGDGLFETIATHSGYIPKLAIHQARIKRGCRRLGFNISPEQWQICWAFIAQQALKNPNCGIKLMLTRGSGGRGYRPPTDAAYEFLVGVFDAPNYSQQRSEGVSLVTSRIQTSINPSLSGMKHLNRLENVLAKQELADRAYEAVMLDANGHVIECVQSNIFWIIRGELFTPALSKSGVQGSCRTSILSNFVGSVNVGHFSLASLQQADEIFVSNALSGILPVVKFDDRILQLGKLTRTLMDQVNT
ncbi:aminodeoxychorismate lyase [Marinomonas gallaica]|uniref:aminodeoxychorismate lyase n=1 Tax=Marinomonas gallaica TaxID=1806667 RepID=UPI003CE52CC9